MSKLIKDSAKYILVNLESPDVLDVVKDMYDTVEKMKSSTALTEDEIRTHPIFILYTKQIAKFAHSSSSGLKYYEALNAVQDLAKQSFPDLINSLGYNIIEGSSNSLVVMLSLNLTDVNSKYIDLSNLYFEYFGVDAKPFSVSRTKSDLVVTFSDVNFY